MKLDLLTCYGGAPKAFRPEQGELLSVLDYPDAPSREALFARLVAKDYSVMGMICSAEPIMTKWKWWLAYKVPAKIFIINENADYFWLDRVHLRQLRKFVTHRLGISGSAAVPSLVRLVFFPVTLAYLLLYAGTVHLRRKLRQI